MKYIFNRTRIFSILFLAFALQLSSCKKDDDDSNTPITPSGSTLKTTVTGRVTDTDDNVVIGVTMVLGTKTTTTDSRGHFIFVNSDVPKDRLVIKGSKQGFFDCIKGKKTQTGGVNYINLVMEELPTAVNISGVSGGVVNIPGGAQITFPANAFTDANGNAYTGMVKIYSRHFNPAAPGFESMVPGGDLVGINAAGQPRSLYSLGMIETLLKDNSGLNEIKLADGITAQLKFPIDPSQSSEAQATIPLWYLNETTGIWKEEGQAIKNGNFFEGNVSHFSTWNCDYQGERTDIVGKVVDCQGVPIAGVAVTINGFMNVFTNNNGEYTTWVPAGYSISCQALAFYNPFLTTNSPIQTITAVGGQINVIPVITVPCLSRISGSVYECGTSQLTPAYIYSSWNGGNQLFYSTDGNYSIMTPENTTMSFQATNAVFSGSNQVTSGSLNSNIQAPPIYLCNQLQLTSNRFTIDYGSSLEVYNVTLNNDSNFYVNLSDQNGDGIPDKLDMNFVGTAQHNLQNIYYNVEIFLDNGSLSYSLNSPGMMSWMLINNSVSAFMSGGNTQNTSNTLTIDDFGYPGGFINGRFEFDSFGATIKNGSFSVRRTN